MKISEYALAHPHSSSDYFLFFHYQILSTASPYTVIMVRFGWYSVAESERGAEMERWMKGNHFIIPILSTVRPYTVILYREHLAMFLTSK